MFVFRSINTYRANSKSFQFTVRTASLVNRHLQRTMASSSLTSTHRQEAPPAEDSKPRYPGLGLPLREYSSSTYKFPFFPIGAHGSCCGSQSLPLPVREVAMMSVMEALTDKPDWHIKVNDDSIISKWRAEALAMPNMHWWQLACSTEHQPWLTDGEHVKIPEDIMSGSSFDCVSLICQSLTMLCQDAHSA